MTSFRKNLEQIYETSQDLGLLNVLLAFEDNELDKIVLIVKNVHIENNEVIMTVKSEDDESQYSEPIAKIEEQIIPDSSSEDEVIIHECFYNKKKIISKGVELREPKPEKDDSSEQPSNNPMENGKRPEGDYIPRPMPLPDKNYDQNLLVSDFIPKKQGQQVIVLDLDCTFEPEKLINAWYSHIMIAMIVSKEIIRSETNS
ncbi:hypothetical protein Adt_31528 [Abeliophyllum distichum]|uniref:Uncharacterized protein n=1 Tax=Abeliophyllum distichum TaxID=126358 RepID=A0ABD1RFP5_9LAMI